MSEWIDGSALTQAIKLNLLGLCAPQNRQLVLSIRNFLKSNIRD